MINILIFYILGYLAVKIVVYIALDFSSKMYKVINRYGEFNTKICINKLAGLSWIGFILFIVFTVLIYTNTLHYDD